MSEAGGYIATGMHQLLHEYLGDKGLDADGLIGKVSEVPPGQVGRYPLARFVTNLDVAVQALNDPLVGLKAGSTSQPRHLGVLGYVVQNCTNAAEAFMRLQQYDRLIYDGNVMYTEARGDEIILTWGGQQGIAGQQSDAFLFAVLTGFARQLIGENVPASRVGFLYPPSTDSQAYNDFFGCQVEYHCEVTTLGLYARHLLLPLKQPDAALCAILDQQAAAQLESLPAATTLEGELRHILPELIRSNNANLKTAAEKLCYSERTLQRRLNIESLRFQEILDKARRDMAQYYLCKPELEVTEVALLCGYAEHSAFSRAFARWTGQSPSAYRENLSI